MLRVSGTEILESQPCLQGLEYHEQTGHIPHINSDEASILQLGNLQLKWSSATRREGRMLTKVEVVCIVL